MQKVFSMIISSNFSYLPIGVFCRAYMILHAAAFYADSFPPCIAEQLVLGTVTFTCMWAAGNILILCCGVTHYFAAITFPSESLE